MPEESGAMFYRLTRSPILHDLQSLTRRYRYRLNGDPVLPPDLRRALNAQFYQECAMTIKVLVVDNDQDQLMIFETVLSRAGFGVIAVASAALALEKIQTTYIDVILCDYMMPDVNGAQMARQLLEGLAASGGRRIPFLLITANSSLLTVTLSLPGVDGIYAKETLRSRVVDRIRCLVEARNRQNN